MGRVNTSIELPYAFSLKETVNSHGWVALSPWCWDIGSEVLSRKDRLPSGDIAEISISQMSDRAIYLSFTTKESDPKHVPFVSMMVKRWLSTEWDPSAAIELASKINIQVAQFIREGGGRFLRGSTFYEDFVKTICTIQISWSGTKRIVSSIVENVGLGIFPDPGTVLDFGEYRLRKEVKMGFRAKVIIETTEALVKRGILLQTGDINTGFIGYNELIGLKGIGPYSAAHMLMLQHDFSIIPIDSEVIKLCELKFGLGADEIQDYFHEWGLFKFLGYKIGNKF